MVEEVVSCGVVPLVTANVGEIGPENKILPAPDDAVPIAAYDSVSVPPVAVGKVTVATGLATLVVTPNPPEVRAIDTRA